MKTIGIALLLCLASLGVSSEALAAVFSQTVTLPTPPQKQFATSGGGDGWDVALSSTQVFNVFHHNSQLIVSCHNQADASQCWPTLTRTVNDGSSAFATSGHPGLYLDTTTGKLYVYATRAANNVGGVVCVDTVAAATNSNPYCGFTALTAAGEASTSPGWSLLSKPMLVGTQLYSFNFFPNVPAGGTSGTTSQNRLLCFDVSTTSACAGQPFAVNLGGTELMASMAPSPGTTALGTQLIIPVHMGSAYRVACFDGSAQTNCTGTWPITTGTYAGSYGPVVPLLDASSATLGFCLPNGSGSCYTLAGASAPTPPHFTSAITSTVVWNGPAVILGPRVYVPNWTNLVMCYDYSTSSSCAGYPKSFSGLSLLYTVTKDPARPTCLWVNSDNGPDQIQNFDAYSGGACNGIRVVTAQFVVPQVKCNPSTYDSLQLVAPAPGTYTSGTVEFDNAAGNPIGIPNETLDATGTVSLTGLSLNTATGLPQFLITLVGAPTDLGMVTVKLTWESNYDPSCVAPGATVTQEASTLATSLNGGGGATGASISVSSGTAVTDTATIAGANASAAIGTVTYTWFSDSACTVVASAGSAQAITTPGALPDSAPVTLGPGTYYPVVSYSGDAGNLASSSNCGDEVLTVTPSGSPPSCALTAVLAGPPKQIQITIQDSSAGLQSVSVTESNNATVAVPSFSPGETGALVVVATKIDQSSGAQVALHLTGVDGLTTDCDPVVPGDPVITKGSNKAGGESAAGCNVGAPVGVGGGGSALSGLLGAFVGLSLVRRRRKGGIQS